LTTYVDSSALVAIYVPERFSKTARAAVRAVPQVPYTALHELEVPNAFEALVGRGLMTRAECRAVEAQLQDDLDGRRLVRAPADLDRVFADACELSRAHTAKHLARSLDLLHVAAAHLAGCTAMVSADDRQLAVAKATGLKVVDIKRRRRRRRTPAV
jgi:predicted nucleic acid-binding protein